MRDGRPVPTYDSRVAYTGKHGLEVVYDEDVKVRLDRLIKSYEEDTVKELIESERDRIF